MRGTHANQPLACQTLETSTGHRGTVHDLILDVRNYMHRLQRSKIRQPGLWNLNESEISWPDFESRPGAEAAFDG